ncbi:class III lanthionine synthetase LanKC [Streptomyces sp. NPDC097619]|uniref:class III lanthionine synthetase LanKC n=1 Tax=Streptomyces sp. NPDC097619 TaxID=3157228 RepID=UPI0033340DFE
MRYEAHSFADNLFYDSPVRWAVREEFAAATADPPEGWHATVQDVWAGRTPAGAHLPEQGWKIHVSARMDNAEAVLSAVSAHCFDHRIAFKFLRSPTLVQTQNAKYAARGSSGKFMTLYPVEEADLERCLHELDDVLAGQAGPYILSDLRWRRGPLYLRYGGFTERYCRSETGELVLALRDPSGALLPDVRGAVFEVPDWAPVPAVLTEALAARDSASTAAFPYTVLRALHFSNGGGIYVARPAGGGPEVVLKEARPHAGLDQRGEDAVTRLHTEHAILRRLAGLSCVPAVHDLHTAWEHHFLVQEHVEGEPLNRWFARHYPLVRPAPTDEEVARYREEAARVLAGIAEGLRAIHARGVVFGDLHPRNLIVRPDGTVCFVDFELASPAADYLRPGLGAAGFAAPADLRGFAIDRYALDALRLWMHLPLMQLTALDPGIRTELARSAEERFGLPAGHLAETPAAPEDREGPRTGAAPTPAADAGTGAGADERARLKRLFTGDPAEWPALRASLAAAVAASATPDRRDRLFPGDPGQFTHDGLGLAYGTAGVLWALHATGAPVDPAHVQWLVDAVPRHPRRPGLYTGSHGVALTLDRLGRTREAHALLERLLADPAEGHGTDLAAGLPGIGLTLLHFADRTGDAALLTAACRTAELLVRRLGTVPGAPGTTDSRRTGLLYGASGAALFLLRLYERTGDPALLDHADRAHARDLERCVLGEDGTLQVDDGSRVLPYLESGSAGIGAVLADLLRHRPDPARRHSLERIRAAAAPEFIVQSGLFNGRAGLLLLLHHLRGTESDTDTPSADLVRRHVRRLTWHLVPYQGHAAFPGEQLLRLSMDLATGTAGVLLALGTALVGTPALPFLGDPVPEAPAAAPPPEAARPAA